MDDMPVEQALQHITNVCRQFRGTLDEHQLLQSSLVAITKAVTPKAPTNGAGVVTELADTP